MNKLEEAVKDWLTLPIQHPGYDPILNDYLEKKGIKATEKQMAEAIDRVTDDLKKGEPK